MGPTGGSIISPGVPHHSLFLAYHSLFLVPVCLFFVTCCHFYIFQVGHTDKTDKGLKHGVGSTERSSRNVRVNGVAYAAKKVMPLNVTHIHITLSHTSLAFTYITFAQTLTLLHDRRGSRVKRAFVAVAKEMLHVAAIEKVED